MANLKEWTVNSNESIQISFANKKFNPEWTYPIFGTSESIFGYKNLKITIEYSQSFHSLLSLSFSDVLNTEKAQAQDVLSMLLKELPGCTLNPTEFKKHQKPFTPMGVKVHEYQRNGSTFEIFMCDFDTKGFKQFHERVQPFMMFFIEGKSLLSRCNCH
jgi:histone acetyltransferase 1